MTLQLNVALVRKLSGSLMCLSYFSEMLSMGVCTTRHWPMSGRLVQKLFVCTVYATRQTIRILKLNIIRINLYWPLFDRDC